MGSPEPCKVQDSHAPYVVHGAGVIKLKYYEYESRTRLRAEALQRAGTDTVFFGRKKGEMQISKPA